MTKPFNDSDLMLSEKRTIADILKADSQEHATASNLATFSEDYVQSCLEKEIRKLKQLSPKVMPSA